MAVSGGTGSCSGSVGTGVVGVAARLAEADITGSIDVLATDDDGVGAVDCCLVAVNALGGVLGRKMLDVAVDAHCIGRRHTARVAGGTVAAVTAQGRTAGPDRNCRDWCATLAVAVAVEGRTGFVLTGIEAGIINELVDVLVISICSNRSVTAQGVGMTVGTGEAAAC